jgi:phosphoesterase RecJ-like protein
VIFIEKGDHVKISFRSKGMFYANKFAENHFNGGGHRNAAGGYSELSLKDTLEKFENLLPDYQEEILKNRI